MPTNLTAKQLDNFHKAALSLKLFSRAELNDDQNRSLIEKLYVDPLPNEQVYKTLLANSTTIIVGRKGTGKSTVFQRVQHELRKNRLGVISAYMDIRNVFEASQIDPLTLDKIESYESALSGEQVQKLLLYKRFFKALLSDLRTELKGQVENSFLTKLRNRLSGTSAEVFSGLDRILATLDAPDYERIEGFVSKEVELKSAAKLKRRAQASGDLSAQQAGPTLKVGMSFEGERTNENEADSKFTQILMRVIGVNDVIAELRSILSAIGINSLYIFLDDFSELPREAMGLLVDALIDPLSRWSDFIKFKVAAYPGRVYLGSLDKSKIEEINLDMFGLYSSGGVTKMEEKAIDFVRRVFEKRISHFCKCDVDIYLGPKSADLWRPLFYASMANPRVLGHVLLYAQEEHLIYGRQIGLRAIQEAAQRFFEEKISSFFSSGKYKVVFEERSSIFSRRELLEKVVSKARTIRQEGSREIGSLRNRPFASHFYISHDYDDLLRSLELSFFVTKYFEQSDRTGMRVSIYALNYGLCIKYQIGFGRPSDKREDRLYFVDRRFDYNSVIRSYIAQNQEIKCDRCEAEFDVETLKSLRMFQMRCPACRQGLCKIVNISKKYGDLIEAISPDLLLPDTELGILQTLNSEKRELVAADIAGELDCSGQLVGRRAKNLFERSLVNRQSLGAVYRYSLTEQARSAYFSDDHTGELNLD